MKRRLSTILSILSVLLCAAVLTLWARSYSAIDWLRVPLGGDRLLLLNSGIGVLGVEYRGHDTGTWPRRNTFYVSDLQSPDKSEVLKFYRTRKSFSFHDYNYIREPGTVETDEGGTQQVYAGPREESYSWWLTFPHWLAVGLLTAPLALPLARLADRRQRFRRLRCGMCPACGYDLRASPQRCPECGAAVPAPTPSSSDRA